MRHLLLTLFLVQRMTDPLDTPGSSVNHALDLARAPGKSSRGRSTTHISRAQAQRLIDALNLADAIGFPLNVSIDIHWEMFAGFVSDQTRLARCQERLSKWCARHGFQLTWIWVREIGRRGGRNTHVLMHVPPWLMERDDFHVVFEAALEASLCPEGEPTHEKAILIQPADNPQGKLAYMLKGVARADASRLGLRKTQFEGEIVGKRVGCTENIGRAARKQHNWISARTKPIATLDAKNHRQNRSSAVAPFKLKASKFEGGIRHTNLDAATGEEIAVAEKFASPGSS
jgi:hypothetical protein